MSPDDTSAPSLAARLARVRAQVAAACAAAGRDPAGVTLIAVSKLQPPAAVAEVAQCGQVDFGENYAQELRDKSRLLPPLRWHFIGGLQRNKVRLVVGTAALIHTVDDLDLVDAIAARARRQAEDAPGFAQDCLIEVNLAGEAQKSGCEPARLPALLDAFAAGGGAVRCLGLMCIPPAPADAPPEASRGHFQTLRALRDQAAASPRPHVSLHHLSMGMSHDFAIAIAEGATLVRVGTAIFGARPQQ